MLAGCVIWSRLCATAGPQGCWAIREEEQICFAADGKTNDFIKSQNQGYGDAREVILARPSAFAAEIMIAWETSPKASHSTVILKCFFYSRVEGRQEKRP